MLRTYARQLGFVIPLSFLLSFYTNCSAPVHEVNSASELLPNGPNGPNGPAPLTSTQSQILNGKVLYHANCAACHGVRETSLKKGADFFRISNAIKSQQEMKSVASLSFLSDDDIKDIAASLSPTVRDEDLACESAPDVGMVALHRLNQFEYRNTVKSVTGVVLSADPNFPSEESAEFSNTALILKTTEAQAEWYLNTAISVVDTMMSSSSLKAKIFNCDLSVKSCWTGAIKTFADKAFRRPAKADELTRLQGLYEKMMTQSAPSETAIKTVFQSLLVTPQFLYRHVDLSSPGQKTVKQKLGPYELASRISYFIWGDAPDATLVAKAVSGELSQAAVLKAEVARMFADPRTAENFSQNFYYYWLGLQELKNRSPSSAQFPDFNESIRSDFNSESKLFFKDLVQNNRPLSELLTADYSYLNQRLAAFYGIGGVTGTSFRKVALSGDRTGALTHGGLMTVTSHSTGTSIVRRGGFIALNLQCIEIPPPPEGAGSTPPPNGKDSVRKRLEAHRANPQCASCHNVMDPPGFGLENFSGVGQLRLKDEEGFTLDTTGTLYNGSTFNNARQLADHLADDRTFLRCGVRKLTSFALGRALQTFDQCTIEKIVNVAGSKPIQDIVTEIIASDVFAYERGE